MQLETPVNQISKIGQLKVKHLDKLGIKNAGDLLYYFPFRYDDYSKIIPIAELKTKRSGTIRGKINLISNRKSHLKKMIITEAIISDKSDSIKAIWFNQPFLTKVLKPGQELYLAGKIDYDERYGLEILNPSYEITKKGEPIHTGRLVPIYPTTASLSQKQIRILMSLTLPIVQEINDWLPRNIKTGNNLLNLTTALEQIHFPQDEKWLNRATERLKFDELFLIQLQSQIVRQQIKQKIAPAIKFELEQTQGFINSLPFKLTDAQRKASWEILKDLEQNKPMNRLLEGDVGSGKTIVAAIAMLNMAINENQAALLAPTEILSRQHFENISNLFKNFDFSIGLLTRTDTKIADKGKISDLKKNELIKKIYSKRISVVIGTHSLIQDNVKFNNLGLVIIDEQHRFGVEQRKKITQNAFCNKKNENLSPHFLSMTATPIPRSLSLTIYGDLDLSIIDQMPPNRKKVEIKIIDSKNNEELERMHKFIEDQIIEGRQVFAVCPIIDPSDKLGTQSVKQEYEKLKKQIFPQFNIGILHGRLSSQEKEKIMRDFLANKINILISTTVVEVGIDVPNASIMLIEGAERFGLAQLYQLQGRVGRSQHQSYCFLVLENDSSANAQKRIRAILTAKNGFELAELDLEMRGEGSILGSEQSGFGSNLKIAKLSDVEIIKKAQKSANQIIEEDPELKNYQTLKDKIKHLFGVDQLD